MRMTQASISGRTTRAIERLAAADNREMGRAGREKALARYDVRRQAASVKEIYETLLATRANPPPLIGTE